MAVPLFRPTIKRAEMHSVLDCLVADSIGPGKLGNELSAAVSSYIGAEGGVAVNSYFSAIKLALESLEIKNGDKIIVSPLVPSVYLEVIKALGIRPLYVDVAPNSASVSSEMLETVMSNSPKLIILHHTLGSMADIESTANYGIPVIEDISQGLGGRIGEKLAGSFGDIAILSLEENNALSCGCGALVLTGNRKLLRELKRRVNEHREYSKLPDLNASLALSQFKYIREDVEVREKITEIYKEAVGKTRHKQFIEEVNHKIIRYAFPVIISDSVPEAEKYIKKHNIETASAFKNSIINDFDGFKNSFPNAANLSLRTLLFPLYPLLAKGNVEKIARVIATLP
ncbi:MAG: hypothetical protein DRP57_05315 [Spirochaetes bacterium]|nr:MAG: hypothetical protein DRP57_05315 [Spirochaetota bacterium]